MENLREAVTAMPEMTREEEDARIKAFFEAADNVCNEAIVVRSIIAKRDGTPPANNEDVEDLRRDLTQARQEARERKEKNGRFVRNGFIGAGAGAGAAAGVYLCYGAMVGGGPIVAAALGVAGLLVGGALGAALGGLILIIIDKIKSLKASFQGKDNQANFKVTMG